MLNIAIVFPIFNGLSYTKDCLKSLYDIFNKIDKNKTAFSVVIVDDASTDGSYEWIKNNFPDVKLLQGDGNLWWSGGINMAIDFAIKQLKTDYLLWWNNDIIPDDEYFVNLVKVIEENDINTIIGSKIYLAQNNNIVWSMGGIFNAHTGYKDMVGTEQKDNNTLQKIIECDWLTGMGTITHKSVYEKIGMINAKLFPQYHGDSDFTYRAKLNGYKIIADPSLKIYNDTRSSGLKHDESLKNLFKSLFSIRSSYNIKKEYKFYKLYSKSYKAYFPLIKKYLKYLGGFFKWKILGLLGYKRNNIN
ncbi:MAG: hypothetical protein B6D61_13620 [Bacteroidetes bacterium 4484_249]|nr:MAG: hypothetical protein B6D61_13620 [Bacteroidetes bacterium 4484_249]